MTALGAARLACLWLCAGSVLCVALPACGAHHDPAGGDSAQRDALRGGHEPGSCDWPAVVALDLGCSGTLVHPEIVVYAAHCGQGVHEVSFGPNVDAPRLVVATDHCEAHPEAALGNGYDVAFCVLAEPVEHLPPLRIGAGCELDALRAATSATLVGFGLDRDAGLFGTKRSGEVLLSGVTGDPNAPADLVVAGGDVGSCAGDSGAPLVVDISAGARTTSRQERLIGVVSAADTAACSPATDHYSYLPPLLPWLESASGRDLTPCFDADGTWNPNPRCTESPSQLVSADAEPHAATCATVVNPLAFASTCGAAFPRERLADVTPPAVALSVPLEREVLLPDDEVALELAVEVSASDADSGVARVRFELADDRGEVRAERRDEVPPYRLERLRLPPGAWNLRAVARDHAQNESEARRSIVVHASARPASGCAFRTSETSGRVNAWAWLAICLMLRQTRRSRAGQARLGDVPNPTKESGPSRPLARRAAVCTVPENRGLSDRGGA
jgi:hypothetical protein